MTVNWAAEQGVNYIILGTGIVTCFLLWVSARVELRNCVMSIEKLRRDHETTVQQMAALVVRTQAVTVDTPPVPGAAPGKSVNLTRRTQVLRMRRRGESIPSIAAALEVPQGEVELVLKLDQLLEAK